MISNMDELCLTCWGGKTHRIGRVCSPRRGGNVPILLIPAWQSPFRERGLMIGVEDASSA